MHAQIVAGQQLLDFLRVLELQVGACHLAGALGIDHLVDDGHREGRHHAHRRYHQLEALVLEFLARQDALDLGLEGQQHVALTVLGEGHRGTPAARGEVLDVAQEAAHERLGGRLVIRELLLRVVPGAQVRIACVARGLGVREHQLHARPCQVVPVADVLGVALAHHEGDGAVVGRAVVRELRGPVLGHQPALDQDLDVGHLVEGDGVGLLALDDVLRLARRAAIGLIDLELAAVLFLPLGHEQRIDLGKQLAAHVIGGVEQRLVGSVGRLGRGHGGKQQGSGRQAQHGAAGAGNEGHDDRTRGPGQGCMMLRIMPRQSMSERVYSRLMRIPHEHMRISSVVPVASHGLRQRLRTGR